MNTERMNLRFRIHSITFIPKCFNRVGRMSPNLTLTSKFKFKFNFNFNFNFRFVALREHKYIHIDRVHRAFTRFRLIFAAIQSPNYFVPEQCR